MKATGAEINAFYRDWPLSEEWYHDDGEAEAFDDDTLDLLPTEKYDLDEQIGCLCWQGEGAPPTHVTYKGQRFATDSTRFLSGLFKAWRDTSVTAVVRLPADQLPQLKAFAKEHGWKIST